MDHSRGGLIHCFSERFKTRKRNFVAASSLGKWPMARTARRSLELSVSMALVVYKIRVMLALSACARGGQVPSPENVHDRGGDSDGGSMQRAGNIPQKTNQH
jgi:hypothetical protein